MIYSRANEDFGVIRTARKGDAESIRKLAQQSWISTYSPYLGEDVVREFVARGDFYSPGELHARMEEETGIVLGAEDQEDGVIQNRGEYLTL